MFHQLKQAWGLKEAWQHEVDIAPVGAIDHDRLWIDPAIGALRHGKSDTFMSINAVA